MTDKAKDTKETKAPVIKAEVTALADKLSEQITAAAKATENIDNSLWEKNLPEGVIPVALTPLGYPDDPGRPKSRKPLEDLVRHDHW